MPHPPSREQFFALLRGDTTVALIEAKRRNRIFLRMRGRRQNVIEQVLEAMSREEFIRFGSKKNFHRPWGHVLGTADTAHNPMISLDERIHRSNIEWSARKWALRKVWARRVEAHEEPRRPAAKERARLARIHRGMGKSKDR